MNGSGHEAGYSLVELLVAATMTLFVLLAALAMNTQVAALSESTVAEAELHGNLRQAMDLLSHDLRLAGYGLPSDVEIGGSATWLPAIFNARTDEIGFRGDTDVGSSRLRCSPRASNTTCTLSRLFVDEFDYYEQFACTNPGTGTGTMPLVLTVDGNQWGRVTCASFDTASGFLQLSANVPDNTYDAGTTEVFTLEHIYYRVSDGELQRQVVFSNTPRDARYAATPAWSAVATGITSLSFEYLDSTGATIAMGGSGVAAGDRALIQRVVIRIAGEQPVGLGLPMREASLRTEVLVRNTFP